MRGEKQLEGLVCNGRIEYWSISKEMADRMAAEQDAAISYGLLGPATEAELG